MAGPWGSDLPEPEPPPRKRFAIGRGWLWLVVVLGVGGLVLALARAFPEALREKDAGPRLAMTLGILAVISLGLVRSGRRFGVKHLRYAALWAAIVAVLALVAAYRDVFADLPQRLQMAFSAGDPVRTGEHELVIPQDAEGSFVAVGKINGQRVVFIVDTGATDTVLTPADAQRLGVDVAGLDYAYEAETANGTGRGVLWAADSIEVGPIRMNDFKVTVNKAPMTASLLGLSFLRKLESFEVRGNKLILRWRD